MCPYKPRFPPEIVTMNLPPNRARMLALVALLGLIGASRAADEPAKGEKKPATIKILLPDNLYKNAEVRIEGVLTKQTNAERSFVTPPLEPGKTYTYKIEAVIEPNNYTKIIRTREITFKAGEDLTLDLRKKDDKVADDVRIRWVPTPEDIAEEMCKLAKIGKDDTVIDCGCGDAILIITAVKKFNAKKAIGVDIDAAKVADAKKSVEAAGLKEKIDIREGNALKQDKSTIGDATVIMTYMGNELNIRFRPVLWNSLKPGTRIVSHRFVFGDWKPEKTVTIKGQDGDDYVLHVWTITGKEKDGQYEKTDKTPE
jgi:uncharacterized protein (TIGR03000 family)